MIELFAVIHACGDVVDYWDVSRRPEGVVVHAKSRVRWPTRQAAVDAADAIAERLVPPGSTIVEKSASARANGRSEDGWHGVVEIVIA
jgi:hypothetical protein